MCIISLVLCSHVDLSDAEMTFSLRLKVEELDRLSLDYSNLKLEHERNIVSIKHGLKEVQSSIIIVVNFLCVLIFLVLSPPIMHFCTFFLSFLYHIVLHIFFIFTVVNMFLQFSFAVTGFHISA